MNKRRALLTLTIIILLTLSFIMPNVSARTPPYIQTGLKFIYQMVNVETQQPENVYHSYIIGSVTPQKISIRIESDVTKPIDLEVDADGNIVGGQGRIDLWIPDNVQVGQTLNVLGYEAAVAMKNFDPDKSGRITFTVVASTDQKTFWLYIDGGTMAEAKQLPGLLYGVLFPGSKKLLALVNIQQGQPVTTTTTTKMTTISKTTRATTQIHTATGTITTRVIVEEETATVTETIVRTIATTVTVEQTVTYQTQVAEVSSQPFIPLPIAIVASIAIIGSGLFYMKSRKRPLPPTYPYPVIPHQAPQPPQYYQAPYTPQPQLQIVGRCPACGYPIYVGDRDCRRCNYRIA
jgi:hypothetical protein